MEAKLNRGLLCLALYGLCATASFAQSANTLHVFPQVADGAFSDGTFYRSTIFAVNSGSLDAACTIQLYGMSPTRLLGPSIFTLVAGGGVIRNGTSGTSEFARGYATLECNQPVQAYVQFELVAPTQEVMGTAAVFPAVQTQTAEFLAPTTPIYRLGLAIANNTDSTATYRIRVGTAGSNELQTNVIVPSRSSIARFADELVSIPDGFLPVAILVESTGADQNPVHSIGLVFSGGVFSTIPAVTFAP